MTQWDKKLLLTNILRLNRPAHYGIVKPWRLRQVWTCAESNQSLHCCHTQSYYSDEEPEQKLGLKPHLDMSARAFIWGICIYKYQNLVCWPKWALKKKKFFVVAYNKGADQTAHPCTFFYPIFTWLIDLFLAHHLILHFYNKKGFQRFLIRLRHDITWRRQFNIS